MCREMGASESANRAGRTGERDTHTQRERERGKRLNKLNLRPWLKQRGLFV